MLMKSKEKAKSICSNQQAHIIATAYMGLGQDPYLFRCIFISIYHSCWQASSSAPSKSRKSVWSDIDGIMTNLQSTMQADLHQIQSGLETQQILVEQKIISNSEP